VPGVQTQALQRPPVQVELLGHDMARVLSPSALQMVTDVDDPHVVAAGVQLQARHVPLWHDCMAAHAVAVYPRPSGLHTRRSDIEAQLTAPGTHTWA